MRNKINGGTIIARADMPHPGSGMRRGEIILVQEPVDVTQMKFVTAVLYSGDKQWGYGNYFNSHKLALEHFVGEVLDAWDGWESREKLKSS